MKTAISNYNTLVQFKNCALKSLEFALNCFQLSHSFSRLF